MAVTFLAAEIFGMSDEAGDSSIASCAGWQTYRG
jgi:hypothetical protein